MSSRNIYLAQTENLSTDKNDACNAGVRGGVKEVELSGALSTNVTVFVVMENRIGEIKKYFSTVIITFE
ncbi:hypothetical protein J6590_084417 [Homalodisca vitripennis]|nr:hypothetical protein J6590_084417 [Homalodisca vitripennis]